MYIKGQRIFYVSNASGNSVGLEMWFSAFDDDYVGLINFTQDMSHAKGASKERDDTIGKAEGNPKNAKVRIAKGKIHTFGEEPKSPLVYDATGLVPDGMAPAHIEVLSAGKSPNFKVKIHVTGGDPVIQFHIPFEGTPDPIFVGGKIYGTAMIASTDSAPIQSALAQLAKME